MLSLIDNYFSIFCIIFCFKHVKQVVWFEMSGWVIAIVYYDGEIHDTDVGVIFSLTCTAWLSFNSNIQISKLYGRIRWKVIGSTQMRVSSLKYRYLASTDPIKYEVFYVKCLMPEFDPSFCPPREQYMWAAHLASCTPGKPYMRIVHLASLTC